MFFERHEGGELAVLVHLEVNNDRERENPQEFLELVRSAGVHSSAFITANCKKPNPKFFLGLGKIQEIRDLVQLHQADVAIFNRSLLPTQERNLEKEINTKNQNQQIVCVLDSCEILIQWFAYIQKDTKTTMVRKVLAVSVGQAGVQLGA